jgi:hypothetical protein
MTRKVQSFLEKSPATPSTGSAGSVFQISGPAAKWTYYCRLGNEHVPLSSAGFTYSTFSMPCSVAKRTFFRSILCIDIGIKHTITFFIYEHRGISQAKDSFNTYFRRSGLKDLAKR